MKVKWTEEKQGQLKPRNLCIGAILWMSYIYLTCYRPKILIIIMFAPKPPWVKFSFGYFGLQLVTAFGQLLIWMTWLVHVWPLVTSKMQLKSVILVLNPCLPNPTITFSCLQATKYGERMERSGGGVWKLWSKCLNRSEHLNWHSYRFLSEIWIIILRFVWKFR